MNSKTTRTGSSLAVIIIILAAIPPLLVFFDRWFNNPDLANYLRDVWCESPVLCDLVWRPYFIFIWVITLAVIVLVKFCGLERISLVFAYPEAQDASVPSVTQRRFGVMLLVASLIGVGITIVRLILAPSLPGWDYILICVLYLGGWFIYTTPRATVVNFFNTRWLRLFVYALGLAALSWLLFSYYGRNHLSVFSLLLAGLAILALIWMRRQLNPSFWLVLLALIVFTLFLNAWNFVIIGDEYAFYETGRGIAFDQSLGEIGNSFFDGIKVYGAQPFFSSVLMALTFRLFDTFNFGWRYGGILPSALSIFFFYYLFRAFLVGWVSWTAAFLIAASHYLMVFSRIGYNNTQAILAMGMALAAVTWAIKSHRPFSFVAIGLAIAFCFYTYPAALFVVPVALWLLLLYYPLRSRLAIIHWGILLGTWFVLILPLFVQPDYWTTKVFRGSVAIRSDQLSNGIALVQRFVVEFSYSFYSFLFAPQESHYLRVGYVDVITGALVLIGLGVLIWRVRAEKFAFFVLTGLVALLFLIGATHGTDLPPNTRMFLLVPWFCLIAAIALQWLAARFQSIRENPARARFALGATLVVILALNLYQAYDTSVRPPAGFLEFDALLVHLAQDMNVQARGASRSIVFVYDPSRHHIPSLQREIDLVYLPVQLVGVDVTKKHPSDLTGQLRPTKSVIALSPQLDNTVASGYIDVLRKSQWVNCSVLSTSGQPRISIWYAPDSPNPCNAPPTGLAVQLPDPFSLSVIILAFIGGLAGLVYLARHNLTPLALESGGVSLPLASAFGSSFRFNNDRSTGPAGSPPQAIFPTNVPPTNSRRGFTLELNIRFTVSTPQTDAVSRQDSPSVPTSDVRAPEKPAQSEHGQDSGEPLNV